MLNKKITLMIMLILVTCPIVTGENSANDLIKIRINDALFDVKVENNSATQELIKTLENKNITINATDYGNFEKVGDLGFSLPTSDENINAQPGDIILYQGNQISLIYETHSWSYTKIGKIENIDSNNLKKTLGGGNVTLVLSLDNY